MSWVAFAGVVFEEWDEGRKTLFLSDAAMVARYISFLRCFQLSFAVAIGLPPDFGSRSSLRNSAEIRK